FRRYLREIVDIVGPEQVLFSSDGPIYEPLVSNRRWVEIMESLTKRGADGIRFTEEEVAAMLGGNAARIFNLTR
ncbi:MAG TPA: amidohydrolase family protein, partial [Dehalococcoidales bacterium]